MSRDATRRERDALMLLLKSARAQLELYEGIEAEVEDARDLLSRAADVMEKAYYNDSALLTLWNEAQPIRKFLAATANPATEAKERSR